MSIAASQARLEDIAPLRRSFLDETRCQVRYEACHLRGWADYYLLERASEIIGYAAIKGQEVAARDTVFEFFVVEQHRHRDGNAFRALLDAAKPAWIECQSNHLSLFSLLCRFGNDPTADAMLFAAGTPTDLPSPGGVIFRRRRDGEAVFDHRHEPVGDWVLDERGRVVATGGFLTHYNRPFVDLHMEVDPAWRRKGLGSFLLQEIQKECRKAGHVPAARCNIDNDASMGALRKAGMVVCGALLKGQIAPARAR